MKTRIEELKEKFCKFELYDHDLKKMKYCGKPASKKYNSRIYLCDEHLEYAEGIKK